MGQSACRGEPDLSGMYPASPHQSELESPPTFKIRGLTLIFILGYMSIKVALKGANNNVRL